MAQDQVEEGWRCNDLIIYVNTYYFTDHSATSSKNNDARP